MINDFYLRSSRIVNFSHKLTDRFYYTTKSKYIVFLIVVQENLGGRLRVAIADALREKNTSQRNIKNDCRPERFSSPDGYGINILTIICFNNQITGPT